MYVFPIELKTQQTLEDKSKQLDDCLFESLEKLEIHIDKDELVKALHYDRDQYNKGLRDGLKIAVTLLNHQAQELTDRIEKLEEVTNDAVE